MKTKPKLDKAQEKRFDEWVNKPKPLGSPPSSLAVDPELLRVSRMKVREEEFKQHLAQELAREREKIIKIAWSLAKQGNYKDGLLLVNALKEWIDERISGKTKQT